MSRQRARRWIGWLLVGFAAVLSGCALPGARQEADRAALDLHQPLPPDAMARLAPDEQILYFTDNVYLAAVRRDPARAEAAAAALRHLQATLEKEDFVRFWTGVDSEFFARVNAVLAHPDYTLRQVAVDARRKRTAYQLGPRHFQGLQGVDEARRLAMGYVIALAAKGDGAACFAFHKAYKEVPDPRAGATLTWAQVNGKPFRKSMWAGSAEAQADGRTVQIPVPAEVVLGCRKLAQPPAAVTAGMVQEVEQFFGAIRFKAGFDQGAYSRNKAAWLQDLGREALAAADRLRLERIMIVNVIDVYKIFPPALDYEYELAVSEGNLPELVASGILAEQDAFVIEQRIEERKILLTGVGVTPQRTPMAFLQMVAERDPPK